MSRLFPSPAPEEDPPSPCNKVCRIDPANGFCLGCGRTGEEIGAWLSFSPAAKRTLLAELAHRPAPLRKAGPLRRQGS